MISEMGVFGLDEDMKVEPDQRVTAHKETFLCSGEDTVRRQLATCKQGRRPSPEGTMPVPEQIN